MAPREKNWGGGGSHRGLAEEVSERGVLGGWGRGQRLRDTEQQGASSSGNTESFGREGWFVWETGWEQTMLGR